MEHCKGDLLSLQTYWVFCAYRTLSAQFVWLKHTLRWCLRDVYSINIHEHPLTIPHRSPLTEFNGHVMVPTTANCRANWDLCLANLDSPVIEPCRQIYARWWQSLMCIMYIYGYIYIYIICIYIYIYIMYICIYTLYNIIYIYSDRQKEWKLTSTEFRLC